MRANVAALILVVVASMAIQVAATPMRGWTSKLLRGSSSRIQPEPNSPPPQHELDGPDNGSPRPSSSSSESSQGSPAGTPPPSPPPPQPINYNRRDGGRGGLPRGWSEDETIRMATYEPTAPDEYRASAFWAKDRTGRWWFYPAQMGRGY